MRLNHVSFLLIIGSIMSSPSFSDPIIEDGKRGGTRRHGESGVIEDGKRGGTRRHGESGGESGATGQSGSSASGSSSRSIERDRGDYRSYEYPDKPGSTNDKYKY